MGYESYSVGEENNKENEGSWIFRIIQAQPNVVKDAYGEALRLALKDCFQPNKDRESETLFMEDVRIMFLKFFERNIEEYKVRGLIPVGYDLEFFEINLKSWVAFMDFRQMINSSLDLDKHEKDNPRWSAPKWEPDPDFIFHLSKYLFDGGAQTQRAFFIGNQRAKMFDWKEVETIKREMIRLEEERIKKEA